MPSCGNLSEVYARRRAALIHRIHKNLREIEEGVMVVQLRAEWAGRINVNLILDDRTCCGTLDLPAALIGFVNRKFPAGSIFGAHPVDVLREVADLIERIPDGELEIALRRPGRQSDLNLREMLRG